MTTDPRGRWAELLRAPADATAGTASSALLRLLPGDEFLPPAGEVAAVNALAGTAAPVGRDPDVEQLLRDEVESFAGNFWALAPADRRPAWAELSRRDADAVRLRELEPGLDVSAPLLADPAADELAALVRELFVLPPRERAIRRNMWLLEHAPDVEKWRAARAVVLRDAPALAALDPDLGAALDPGFHCAFAFFVEGATAAPIAVAATTARVTPSRGQETGVLPLPVKGSKGGFTMGWVVVFGLFMAVKLLLSFGRSDTTTGSQSVPRLPNYSAPTPDPSRPGTPAPRTFTGADVIAFEQYERAFDAGKRGDPPPGYAAWRLADRPRGASPTGAGENSVFLGPVALDDFRAYERSRSGPPPKYYADWVLAGRPRSPGPIPVAAGRP